MGYFIKDTYIIEDYQKQKPFSSFLSGIAGKMGKPLWSFYVNRGQVITSFGLRDKNGAIQEFYPGNLAYIYTPINGFRTFVKVDGIVHEFFNEINPNQKLLIDRHQVSIEEVVDDLLLKIKVTYYTLPNLSFAGLARKVELTNLSSQDREITLVDGLMQILPSGIDYGGYKAVSNLLQSWMLSKDESDFMFYTLSGSTEDSSEVNKVESGNYYFTKFDEKVNHKYIYDYKKIFNLDSSFRTPYGFIEKSYDEVVMEEQASINQVPSALTILKHKLEHDLTFISVLGYANDKNELKKIVQDLTYEKLNKKQEENKLLHEELLKDITVETSDEIFDNYLKQCYLDNLMRGGVPLLIETIEGKGGYHLFSRKHGDLERDYNFFSIEPSYYSQGNGNFRDVLQNRRNDLFFYPEINDFNIYQFGNLIQADGYNPLSIEGIKFKYIGNKFEQVRLSKLLQKEFTLGELATLLHEEGLDVNKVIKEVLKSSKIEIIAHFGEGYWQDHFTYLYDLIESYLSIYPDKEKHVLFLNMKYRFFNSPVKVKKRIEKSVINKHGKIRQYDAILHEHKEISRWLKDKHDEEIKTNLISKLITLTLNKYALLDPEGIGVMYEANKPGWNDALNGLPGLFASGISETIELKKLVEFVKYSLDKYKDEKIKILITTNELKDDLLKANSFDERMHAIETYRDKLDNVQELITLKASDFIKVYEKMDKVLSDGLSRAKKLNNIYPSYLTYDVETYEKLETKNNQGLTHVKPLTYKLNPIAPFLEAPARYISRLSEKAEANDIYKIIKNTELYDKKMKFYQTSVSLDQETDEIGRIKAFQKGWLERESNFLHMTYKYLLALLKAGLYDIFYEEIKTNFTCYMDAEVYGRNPLENSSFIVTSSNLDKSKHGTGFVARLSGSTAEMLSMWRYMFLGKNIFTYEDELIFKLEPKLHQSFFKENIVKTNLFKDIEITYHIDQLSNTYDDEVYKYEISDDKETLIVMGSTIKGDLAEAIRNKKYSKIKAYIKGGK